MQSWLQEHASENLHTLKLKFWAVPQPFHLLARHTQLTHLHIERIYFTITTASRRLASECVSASLTSLKVCTTLPLHTFSLADLNKFQQLQHLRIDMWVQGRVAVMRGDFSLSNLQTLVLDGSFGVQLSDLTLRVIPVSCQPDIEGVNIVQQAARDRDQLGIDVS